MSYERICGKLLGRFTEADGKERIIESSDDTTIARSGSQGMPRMVKGWRLYLAFPGTDSKKGDF